MHPSGMGGFSEKKGLHLKKSAKGTKNDNLIYSKCYALRNIFVYL